MRDPAEIDADILNAARKIHNAGVQIGQGYRELLASLNEHYQAVFDDGGGLSATDFAAHASPERVRTDLINLLVAAGLSDMLKQASRQEFKAEPLFFQRYQELVDSGVLQKSRGKPRSQPDPLSAYKHPGVKLHSTGLQSRAQADGSAI